MGRNLVFRGLPVHTGNSPIIASLGRAWLGPGCHLFVTAEPRVSTVYRRCSPIILVSVRRGSILLLCLFVCLIGFLVVVFSLFSFIEFCFISHCFLIPPPLTTLTPKSSFFCPFYALTFPFWSLYSLVLIPLVVCSF